MMRLLRVELIRLLARRAVLVLLTVAVIIPTVIGVARVLDTRPPSDQQMAEWERMAAADAERPYVQREIGRCVEKPRRYGIDPQGDVQADCEESITPTWEWYGWYQEMTLREERDSGGGLAIVVVIAMLMLLVGTTFAGHDWASGSMSNQLLFEPRRLRVWAAKAIALTLVALLTAAVVITVYWLAMTAVVSSREGDTSSKVVLDCLQDGWRGAALAAGAALAGYALAMLFRSTVASLGVVAGIAVAGGIVLATVGVGTVWDPALNALAFVQDGAKYWVEVPCPGGGGGGFCEEERVLPLARGAMTLGAGLLVALVVSALSFQRRDVP